MPTSEVVLDVNSIDVSYGHVSAIRGASLTVGERELVALLGANGAGKSTLLRSISGMVPPQSGTVHLRGTRLDTMRPRDVTRAGVIHVPEGRQVVAPLTVQENLELAARASGRRLGTDLADGFDEVYDLFPRLADRRGQPSGLLSGGEQQMLALGRGIMARPEILLLDEPSMGLAPIIIEQIFELLRTRTGTLADTAILLAEQSAALAMSVADRVYVLTRGDISFEGTTEALKEDTVAEAYLGGSAPRERSQAPKHTGE